MKPLTIGLIALGGFLLFRKKDSDVVTKPVTKTTVVTEPVTQQQSVVVETKVETTPAKEGTAWSCASSQEAAKKAIKQAVASKTYVDVEGFVKKGVPCKGTVEQLVFAMMQNMQTGIVNGESVDKIAVRFVKEDTLLDPYGKQYGLKPPQARVATVEMVKPRIAMMVKAAQDSAA